MTLKRMLVAMGALTAGLTLMSTTSGASGTRSTGTKSLLMPSATRLGTTQTLPMNGIRLTAPPSNAKPLISARQAWNAVGRHPTSGKFKVVLAEWHSTVPVEWHSTAAKGYATTKPTFLKGLVWVIEGQNVKLLSLGDGKLQPETLVWPVNASTGEAGPEYAY